MENLLTTLSSITTYTTKHGFADVCWHSLSRIIGSKDADMWTVKERDHFMMFTQFFIRCGEAVFTVRDALIRDAVTDLNSKLVTELVEPLDWLEEFNSALEFDELNETIDEYTEILLNIEKRMIESDVLEFAASHFKSFFLTVYALNMEKRIDSIRDFHHN
ncbi:hypothetical protein QFZ51_004662 [Chitinophaga sp. W3I9]|uniref:hypothetical protein n=1 Tax=Chitinophaga sp. W3I9 TaxID=3373924 RepID=UPI003D19C966